MHWEDLEGAGGEGGGSGDRDGEHMKPMAVSFQCLRKFTTNKKKTSIGQVIGESEVGQGERMRFEAQDSPPCPPPHHLHGLALLIQLQMWALGS